MNGSNVLDRARQTLFLVRESSLTRKLIFPKGWRYQLVPSRELFMATVEAVLASDPRVVIVVAEEDFTSTVEVLKQKHKDDHLRYGVVVLCEEPEKFLAEKGSFPELLDAISEKDARRQLEFHLVRALRHLCRSEEKNNSRFGQKTLEQLNEIFIAMSAERNPQRLLATILLKAMDLTLADGGILYMVEEKDGELFFRLKISYDRSNEITFQHSTVKMVENSIVGYSALTAKAINVPNVNELRPLTLPTFNRQFDYNPDENTHSLLTLPFKNGRNEIIAVLQLANKRAEVPTAEQRLAAGGFEADDEALLRSFSTQAAICLENVDLYADIQRLFEGFIKASITAIESRDPSTGGHSERVAKICVGLARATSECDTGIYRSVRFKEEEIRELEYAALLHDFGKIGVREDVLVKAKKLFPYQLEAIKERIKICKAAAKIAYLEKQLKAGHDARSEKEFQDRINEIDSFWQIILSANEPSVLQRGNKETLERIRSEQLLLPDGSQIAVLTEDEYNALSVMQGSLTESERLEIESHVRHTYQFLKMIPWTKDFRHLTEIAYCHHEKLDGSGYPRGLMSHEIPLQSKIMTIADIFDALTAADRWYKEAVPTEKALDILSREVAKGQLDPVLFELFVQKKIYELTQPKLLNNVA